MSLNSKRYDSLPKVFHFETLVEIPIDLRVSNCVIGRNEHVVQLQDNEHDSQVFLLITFILTVIES